jgi:hypothetical protein
MKKTLAILLLLLIAVGCDDSTKTEQAAEQPEPVPADPPVIELPSVTNTIGMTLNKIPAGTFIMGSPRTEIVRLANETQHPVSIQQSPSVTADGICLFGTRR